MTVESRWTIVRKLPPERRRPSQPQVRQRAVVRCVCGLEREVYVEDLEGDPPRSSGCKSHRCRARFDIARELEHDLDARFTESFRLHERLTTWLLESGRRDRYDMHEALSEHDADNDNDSPPTRARSLGRLPARVTR